MRVTKLIKEYVEEQVKAKYPQTAEEKALKEFETKLENKQEILNDTIKKYAEELCQEANKELGIENWDENRKFAPNSYCYNLVSFSLYNSELGIKAEEARRERNKKITDTIKEILINLELGATKTDLDEMLSKI